MKTATAFITALILAGVVTNGLAEDASKYVGIKSCKMCHKKDATGNQAKKWADGPHAKAYSMLASDEAKAAGAKVGVADPQKSPKCLKCHASAYLGSDSVQTETIAVEDGVVCESCHGAGKDYKKMSVMKNHAKALENGLVFPATKSCEKCHNDTSPTWKPDRYTTEDGKTTGFDVDQAYEKIKHENPKSEH